MNQDKKLLYAILMIITIHNGYTLGNPYGKDYHINWPYGSKIYSYCYERRDHFKDENCGIMHNYIIARAAASRITNYKTLQEKKLNRNQEELINIETAVRDNFLTEFELDARKNILLKKQETIKERLAIIPTIEKRITADEFFNLVKDIMTKANITSDEDIAYELGVVLEILKKADTEKADKYHHLYF